MGRVAPPGPRSQPQGQPGAYDASSCSCLFLRCMGIVGRGAGGAVQPWRGDPYAEAGGAACACIASCLHTPEQGTPRVCSSDEATVKCQPRVASRSGRPHGCAVTTNPYEDPRCQETHYPSERIFLIFFRLC